MQYKKTTKSVKQVGDELGVSYILQGTVRWEMSDGTTRIRVNTQLINVADGTQIWSQPFESIMSGVFKLQSEIAGEVAGALNVALLQPEREALEAKLTENSEAYDYYLRGNEYLYRSTGEQDYRIAEQMLQRAVELDPKFAEAYARLGGLHAHIYWEYYDHTEERVRKSREAAEKALQLDPDLPDAHGAMGWYYYHCRLDYENALREFNLALKAQPNNIDVLLGIGAVYRRQGRFDDSIVLFKRAAEIDPRSASLIGAVAETYLRVRKYVEAEQYIDRTINVAPDKPEWYCDKAYLYAKWKGDIQKARKVLEDAEQRKVGAQDPLFLHYTVIIDMMGGRYQGAIDRLETAEVKVFDYQYWYIPKEILLAQLNGYLKRSQKARTYYDAARVVLERDLHKHPDDARIHSSLGIVYAGLGRKDDAIREGKHAVDLLPISREAVIGTIRVQDLALIYTMVGEQDAGVDQLEKLLSIPSDLSVPLVRIDPAWNPLRSNPRFKKLLSENK